MDLWRISDSINWYITNDMTRISDPVSDWRLSSKEKLRKRENGKRIEKMKKMELKSTHQKYYFKKMIRW